MTEKITIGSGNVFADLGLPNPRERQAKAMIALHISRLIKAAKYTQSEAAARMDLTQPDVSNIVNGRLKGFTLDRLFDCLDALGQRVEISISPRADSSPEDRVLVLY